MAFYLIILLFLSLTIVALVFLIKIFGWLYTFLFWGAIYVPTKKEGIDKMVEFLEIKPRQVIADLGAGDGRLLIALAKAGAIAYGYEINPFLVDRARKNIKEAGLEDRAFVYLRNLWHTNLNDFDGIVVFGMKHMMKRLEKKFEKELKPGAKVVSNHFPLPNWTPEKKADEVYLYVGK